MKHIYIAIAIALVIVTIPLVIFLSGSKKVLQNANVADGNNVSLLDGKQIINLSAKGGFRPIHSIAKAGVPTVLRVATNGTFDCSSVIRIPNLALNKMLPATGTTDIYIGSPKVGLFNGTCGMGMYPFDIDFQS